MPYFYLYDSYLQDRSYANLLIKLETTLTDLGIAGRVGRLTLLKSVKDLVEAALREGTDTVVAVGNDITLSQIAQVLAKYPKVALGFVPLGNEHQVLADVLGIPRGVLACHVLSGRIIAELPLGKINQQYFIQSVVTQGSPVLECEGSFTLTFERPHHIRVVNLDDVTGLPGPQVTGSLLTVVVKPLSGRGGIWPFRQASPSTSAGAASVLPLKQLRLVSQGDELPIIVDGYRTLKTPATITLAPKTLRFIVGKKRLV